MYWRTPAVSCISWTTFGDQCNGWLASWTESTGKWLDEMKPTLDTSQNAKQCCHFVPTSGDQWPPHWPLLGDSVCRFRLPVLKIKPVRRCRTRMVGQCQTLNRSQLNFFFWIFGGRPTEFLSVSLKFKLGIQLILRHWHLEPLLVVSWTLCWIPPRDSGGWGWYTRKSTKSSSPIWATGT